MSRLIPALLFALVPIHARAFQAPHAHPHPHSHLHSHSPPHSQFHPAHPVHPAQAIPFHRAPTHPIGASVHAPVSVHGHGASVRIAPSIAHGQRFSAPHHAFTAPSRPTHHMGTGFGAQYRPSSGRTHPLIHHPRVAAPAHAHLSMPSRATASQLHHSDSNEQPSPPPFMWLGGRFSPPESLHTHSGEGALSSSEEPSRRPAQKVDPHVFAGSVEESRASSGPARSVGSHHRLDYWNTGEMHDPVIMSGPPESAFPSQPLSPSDVGYEPLSDPGVDMAEGVPEDSESATDRPLAFLRGERGPEIHLHGGDHLEGPFQVEALAGDPRGKVGYPQAIRKLREDLNRELALLGHSSFPRVADEVLVEGYERFDGLRLGLSGHVELGPTRYHFRAVLHLVEPEKTRCRILWTAQP